MSRVVPQIMSKVVRYTKHNPEAADTAEGIAKWWLHDEYPVTKVKDALDQLVAEGVFEAHGRGDRQIYKFRRRGR